MKHDQQAIRQKLIEGTIRIIARDGLDKATTKLIGTETATNEAYIYRCFEDKEDMFAKTFEVLDTELSDKVLENVSVMYRTDIPYETRCWTFFGTVWRFFLDEPEKSITYIRYYYSPYFDKVSLAEHTKRFQTVVSKFREAFRDEANIDMLLYHILMTMMGFSMQVFNGVVPDDDDTAEHVFRLVFAAVRQYLRKEEYRA